MVKGMSVVSRKDVVIEKVVPFRTPAVVTLYIEYTIAENFRGNPGAVGFPDQTHHIAIQGQGGPLHLIALVEIVPGPAGTPGGLREGSQVQNNMIRAL